MFTIRDGRDYLYAWDLDRQIIVDDPSITEVHFSNRTDDNSLVVEVKDEDGLRVANIPNILLQQPWDIIAYAYCPDSYTKMEEVLEVKDRPKPADYIYTEAVDLSNYYTKAEVDALIPSHEGLATEDYVNTAIQAINIPDVPTTVSAFTNDVGYQTANDVNTAIQTALSGIAQAEGGAY